MSATFSARLTELRHEYGISQKEAAIDLGVSQALLSHYEKGIRECGLDFVVRAAKYYQVTTDYLLGAANGEQKYISDFDENDLPRDSQLCLGTIFRATAFINKYLSAAPSVELAEKIKWFFSLCVYKSLLMGADAHIIPKEWLQAKGKAVNLISVSVIDAISNDILSTNDIVSKNQFKEHEINKKPLCVKTLIEETENLIWQKTKEYYE